VNLTSADISDLAVRAHRLMENALQEISTHDSNDIPPVQEQMTKRTLSEVDSTTEPGVLKEDSEMPSARTSSSTSLGRRSSEAGSTAETESDEGMVLVGRPT
jgi:hypothetical protein